MFISDPRIRMRIIGVVDLCIVFYLLLALTDVWLGIGLTSLAAAHSAPAVSTSYRLILTLGILAVIIAVGRDGRLAWIGRDPAFIRNASSLTLFPLVAFISLIEDLGPSRHGPADVDYPFLILGVLVLIGMALALPVRPASSRREAGEDLEVFREIASDDSE